jgi:hypothetical protein
MRIAMTSALPFADLPSLLQEAISRKPRRAPTRPHASPQNDFSHNNYLAKRTPNWGRNKKGAGLPGRSSASQNAAPVVSLDREGQVRRCAAKAGAPRGNRNAYLGGLRREDIQLLRLQARNKMNAERLPLLAAKIAALEALFAARQGEGVR